MTTTPSHQELHREQIELQQQRSAVASLLQHFCHVKADLPPDGRVAMSTELVYSLNQLDARIEELQFQLDVS